MNKRISKFLPVVLLACVVGPIHAQTSKPETPRTVNQILDRSVANAESEFVPAAEAMPEDKYTFAPTTGEFKGVRTFAQQVKHVSAVNYLIASAVLGEKAPVEIGGENGPDSVKSKDEIVKFAKDSFAYLHKAASSVNEKNAAGTIKNPFGEGTASRLGMTVLVVSHVMDHYGQMVEYLRMNGIVPPASRQ
jgi:uncharacterized damage-inducible protein DinB